MGNLCSKDNPSLLIRSINIPHCSPAPAQWPALQEVHASHLSDASDDELPQQEDAQSWKTRPLPPDWYLPLAPGCTFGADGQFYLERNGMKITHTSIRKDKEEEYRVRRYDEDNRARRAARRHGLPPPSDFRRLCFRASDIVTYISTMLEGGPRYTSNELASYARQHGVYFAQEMYRLGFPFTTSLERVTAVTYTWADLIPPALQVIYDQECSSRFNYYGASWWECLYFKSNGAIPNEDRRGWVIPRTFVWLDIINLDQNCRQLADELSILPGIFGGAGRHVVASANCFSRGWCLFEMALRSQALLGPEPGDERVKWLLGRVRLQEPDQDAVLDVIAEELRQLAAKRSKSKPSSNSNSNSNSSSRPAVDQDALKEYFRQVMSGFDEKLPYRMSYVNVPVEELQRRLQAPTAIGPAFRLPCTKPLGGLLLHRHLKFDDLNFDAAGFSVEADRQLVREAVDRELGGMDRFNEVIQSIVQVCARRSFMEAYIGDNF